MIQESRYLSPEKACNALCITRRTLQMWESQGKIACIRTKGGHRRFLDKDIIALKGVKKCARDICYCRVSTIGQKGDLERQIEYFRGKFPDHEIVQDIGSGLNFKRKGFNSILDDALKGNIGEIVVSHKDRLVRFGFELVERIVTSQGGRILVLDQQETSPQEELVNDIISIITVFSSRLYGLRSHSLKKKIRNQCETYKNSKDEDISDTDSKREIAGNV